MAKKEENIVWEKEICRSTRNRRLDKDRERCPVMNLTPSGFEGTKRCPKKNGYGAYGLYCKQHKDTIMINDSSSDCFFDSAPRYGD